MMSTIVSCRFCHKCKYQHVWILGHRLRTCLSPVCFRMWPWMRLGIVKAISYICHLCNLSLACVLQKCGLSLTMYMYENHCPHAGHAWSFVLFSISMNAQVVGDLQVKTRFVARCGVPPTWKGLFHHNGSFVIHTVRLYTMMYSHASAKNVACKMIFHTL